MKKRALNLICCVMLLLTVSSIFIISNGQETNTTIVTIQEPMTTVVTTQVDPIGPIFDSDLEWKVTVGEIKQYTFTKLFDIDDGDEDGNPYTQTGLFISENGSEIEVVIRKGSTLFCEILAINENPTIQMTINGINLEPSEGAGLFVMPTVDNRTYWEEYAEKISNTGQNVSIEGNLMVTRTIETWKDRTFAYVTKLNWRTGWLSSIYQRDTNDTHLLREMELTNETPGLIPGFEISPFPLSLILFCIYLVRKRRKNDKYS
ncbi:MAG: hypothetical protein ACXABU_02640 [Candidatus Hodarchaeales archaeon]